ncbi:MAG: DUF2283 domain-containing protein [Hormoscilla sp. GM102CHS1]|nr:DUF2283 domain-containing protein [Hormoscilla sp. GM102CHS1]
MEAKYDAEGNAIGIEILNASQKIQNFNPALSETMPPVTV